MAYKRIQAVAYLRTSSAANVGADKDSGERQRQAIHERTPDLLPLFDALAEATRALAAGVHA